MGVKYRDLMLDLLECSVHQLLFLRGLYPPNVFEARVKFGVPVKRCAHPKVNLFIEKKIKSIAEFNFDALKAVDIVLLTGEKQEEVLSVGMDAKSTGSSLNGQEEEVERHFRAVLLKMNHHLSILKEAFNEDGCFTFRLHTTTDRKANNEVTLQWAQKSHETEKKSVLIPIHCMKKPFHVQIVFQQFL